MEQSHCPRNLPMLHLPIPPALPAAGNHWSFYCHHCFAFPRKPYSWNHAIWSLSDWLLSLSHGHLRFFPVFLWLNSSFFFSLEHYSITWMCHSLFIHLPKDILVGFQVLEIMNKIKLPCAGFCVDLVSVHLGKCLRVYLLGCKARVCLALKAATKLSFKVSLPLCSPSSNEGEFWWLH